MNRKECFREFVKTATWLEYLKPYLENRIARYTNIRNLDSSDVANSYLKNLVKADMCRNIIFKIEKEWQEEKNAE